MTSFFSLLTAAAIAACAGHRPSAVANRHDSIKGSRTDVTTSAGPKGSYIVESQCEQRDCFGIRGTGTEWYAGMERDRIGEDARFRAAFDRFRDEVTKAVGLRSIHGSALGAGCREFGLVLWSNDWRDIDTSIDRVGRKLAADNLREEVTICIAADANVEIER